jgi:hypothetical protein
MNIECQKSESSLRSACSESQGNEAISNGLAVMFG